MSMIKRKKRHRKMTTPPTNAQMDTMFASMLSTAFAEGTTYPSPVHPWCDENGMVFLGIPGSTPHTTTQVYVGWTDSTSAQYLEPVQDPRDVYDLGPNVQQFGDPAVGAGTAYLQGLIAQYGAINLRKYTITYQTASDVAPAASAEQLNLNDQANWVAAP
jgi:hypothetical protein